MPLLDTLLNLVKPVQGITPPRLTPQPPSMHDQLVQAARQKYPFIGDTIMVPQQPNNPYSGEGWPIGEPGDLKAPRPKEIPLNKPGIEVDPRAGIDDLAGEALHVNPYANQTRDNLIKTLTPEQKAYLSHASADYGSDPNVPEEVKLRNGMDGAIRGTLVNQWPPDANAGMKYRPEQRQMLDSLGEYMKTGKQPGIAAPK